MFSERLSKLGEELGYKDSDYSYGYCLRWVEAKYLNDEADFNKKNELILNPQSAREIEKIKSRKLISLTENQANLQSMLGFYKSMDIYQNPENYSGLFNGIRYSRYKIQCTSTLAASDKFFNQGARNFAPLVTINSRVDLCTPDELVELLISLRWEFNKWKKPMALLLTDGSFTIALYYNYTTNQQWELLNIRTEKAEVKIFDSPPITQMWPATAVERDKVLDRYAKELNSFMATISQEIFKAFGYSTLLPLSIITVAPINYALTGDDRRELDAIPHAPIFREKLSTQEASTYLQLMILNPHFNQKLDFLICSGVNFNQVKIDGNPPLCVAAHYSELTLLKNLTAFGKIIAEAELQIYQVCAKKTTTLKAIAPRARELALRKVLLAASPGTSFVSDLACAMLLKKPARPLLEFYRRISNHFTLFGLGQGSEGILLSEQELINLYDAALSEQDLLGHYLPWLYQQKIEVLGRILFNEQDKNFKNFVVLMQKIKPYLSEVNSSLFIQKDFNQFCSILTRQLSWLDYQQIAEDIRLAATLSERDHYIQLIRFIFSIDINQANDNGATALFLAAQNNFKLSVRHLLLQPLIDPNKCTALGATPALIAAQEGHLDVLNLLAVHPKIDLNKATLEGITPLYAATEMGHFDAVRALVEKNVDQQICARFNSNEFLTAAQNISSQAYKRAKKIIDRQQSAEKDVLVSTFDIAWIMGHEKIMEYFLSYALKKEKIDDIKLILAHPGFTKKMLKSIDNSDKPILSYVGKEISELLSGFQLRAFPNKEKQKKRPITLAIKQSFYGQSTSSEQISANDNQNLGRKK